MPDTRTDRRPETAPPGAVVPVPRAPDRADRVVLPGRAPRPAVRREVVGTPIAPGLVRDRLNRVFAAFAEHRISAVVAPTGTGKTTALAHWARDAGLDVAWLRVASRPEDPLDATVRGLAGALHVLDPSRPRAGDRDTLITRFAQYDGTPYVIVDDFHHLDTPEVAALVDDLLDASTARVVVAARREPGLHLARSEFPSLLVGPEDLRLRTPEIERLFADVYQEPLSGYDAWSLAQRTDGLAAAVHLFHQATRNAGPAARREALHHVGAQVDLAMASVVAEALGEHTSADVELLRLASPLEVLTPGRCADLTGRPCGGTLRDLARHGTLRPVAGGYVLPKVIRRHLLEELRDVLGEGPFVEHVRRCARANLADGRPAAAVRAFVLAGDLAAAEAVLATDGADVLLDPDLSWADAWGLCERWSRRARAVRGVREGRFEDAARELAEGGGAVADPATPQLPDGSARLVARLQHVLRVWTAGDVQPGDCWFEQLRAVLRSPDPARGGRRADGQVLHAVAAAVAGDLVTARQLCGDGSEGRSGLVLRLLDTLLDPDASRADRLVDEAERAGVPWLVRVAGGLADPASVDRRIREADATADPWGALLLAGVRVLRGLVAQRDAVAECEDLAGRCRALDVPALEAWARTALAVASARADLPEALRDAEMAVAFAHSAQVPGALAAAWGVLGTLRDDAGLVADAAAQAAAAGFDLAPWDGLRAGAVPRPAVVAEERVAPLEVRCFGGFSVRVDGAVPTFRGVRPRARELLRMLALDAGSQVHRELIIDALWPQLDYGSGTHNLHVSISSLRTALEPGVGRGASRFLVRDGDRYALLLPPGSTADLVDFTHHVRVAEESRAAGESDAAVAALERALELYAGDVLPEDGPAEWAVAVRDRFKVRACEAAALLGDLHLHAGRPEEAAAALQRSLEIEPCRDASWRLLIRAYEATGDLAAAERAWRAYRAVLASLGVVGESAELLRSRSR
ncbi:BTAD domain-containing putative transcriptional regulator [Nocardioides humi]|uniref:ATP-, maltotriose-and DNA-dependent transcriptional regulator MalT n=1 Tax=Nocardioides humi TaxID=449461 RepID=A0ABN2B1V2_9ACTN|nr:BTAD domain-containing putative transcriptional regulator [Nocardioides humi]